MNENFTKSLRIYMLQLLTTIRMHLPHACSLKKVQNMMHYAVHGHTAAELIVERASADKGHKLGLVLKHVIP